MRLLSFFLFFISVVSAQTRSGYYVEIVRKLYVSDFEGNDSLYSSDKFIIKDKPKIGKLVKALNLNKSLHDVFLDSGIDTVTIKSNPKSLIKYYNEGDLRWNTQQVDFISEKLGDISVYKKYFYEYLSRGAGVTMHQRYKDLIILTLYDGANVVGTFTSRKSLPGTRKIPWENNKKELNYNPDIDEYFYQFTGVPHYIETIRKSKLTKQFVNQIVNYYNPILYDLSAYDYLKEIQELSPEFEIKKFGEVYGRGRYIWNQDKTFYVRLHNKQMSPNIDLMFLAEKQGRTIYSRQNVIADYKMIVQRVQQIDFITDFIVRNPSAKLDIYFFNDKPVNSYNIEGFNQSPEKWVKHDKYLGSIKKYKDSVPRPSFAEEDAIAVSKFVDCGCNYRLNKEIAEQAVFFELTDSETKSSSVWFLLPDDRVLLYIMEGEKVLNYSYKDFGRYPGIQHPCVMFDLGGNIIDRR